MTGQREAERDIDADLIVESGVTDLSTYGGGDPKWDIFVDKP